jgi:hypothetical protein
MKSRIKAFLIAGYNHGLLSDGFVRYWFNKFDLRAS